MKKITNHHYLRMSNGRIAGSGVSRDDYSDESGNRDYAVGEIMRIVSTKKNSIGTPVKPTADMDNLAKDAMKAKQAGMSYGRWKALQEPAKPKTRKIPDGWRCCAYCGEPFKPRPHQKFCDIECRENAYSGRTKNLRRDYFKEYRERKKQR